MTWVTPDPNWWPLVLLLLAAAVIVAVVEHMDRRDEGQRQIDELARRNR